MIELFIILDLFEKQILNNVWWSKLLYAFLLPELQIHVRKGIEDNSKIIFLISQRKQML